MKRIKTKYKKYPNKVTFDNGRSSPVPSQHRFKNDFIRNHGCSMAAFYIAMRFCGHKDKMGKLLSYARKSLGKYMKAKLTIKGVAKGINNRTGRRVARYHRTCSKKAINRALDAGHLVLLETGDPIHTNVIYRSSGKTYHLDHGNVRKIDVDNLIKKATKSSTYRGWVDIKG